MCEECDSMGVRDKMAVELKIGIDDRDGHPPPGVKSKPFEDPFISPIGSQGKQGKQGKHVEW